MRRYVGKYGVMLAGLLAVNAWAGEPGPGGSAPAAFVAATRAVDEDDVEIRRYVGKLMTPASVQLTARVSGELTKLGFAEGSFVEKGQTLFELDSVRYVAALKNAEAKLAENRARAQYAESRNTRRQFLLTEQVVDQDSAESVASEHEAAQAAVLAAEAGIVASKDDLANTTIVAPLSGKIGLARYTAGNYVTPSSGVLATVVQMDPLRVGFSVSNRDFLTQFGTEAGLKRMADVRIRLANDEFYEHGAVIEFIDNQANRNTDTVTIYASIPNPEHKLIPDSAITVVLARKNGGTLPAVPPSAVVIDRDGAFVWVVGEDDMPERRPVVLGPSRARSQLLKEGVRTGEWVVTEGTHKVRPGAKLEVARSPNTPSAMPEAPAAKTVAVVRPVTNGKG